MTSMSVYACPTCEKHGMSNEVVCAGPAPLCPLCGTITGAWMAPKRLATEAEVTAFYAE